MTASPGAEYPTSGDYLVMEFCIDGIPVKDCPRLEPGTLISAAYAHGDSAPAGSWGCCVQPKNLDRAATAETGTTEADRP